MDKKKIYRALGLDDKEYKKILNVLGRKPSLTELAMFSVEWSEHCGYSYSRNLLKLFPRTGRYPVFAGEDSGGIIIGRLAVVFKMESHNHPSQIEPKQGAATGVGGIVRDIFTAGAKPVASLDSLRFGPLSNPYNRYLMKGVVDGIQFYGNCIGVPTVGGEIYFDESYSGNCLVNVMNIGIADKNRLVRARAKGAGNPVMYVGSATGRDGIGGCSVLASEEFKKNEAKRPAVQIGDPFTEKCLIEATLEAIATGYIEGIKDMGAAGLTCSITEMASAGNMGIEAELDLVPRREELMEPWEVMMSESQERMLACIKKGKEKRIKDIFNKWGLNATVIGRVTPDGLVRIKNKGKIEAEIKAHSITNAPICSQPCKKPEYINKIRKLKLAKIPEPKNYNRTLLKLLASPSVASKKWVYRQYDHMVQTNTVVLPGSDAAVIKLKGTNKAIAATTDCNSRYCYLNPYVGSQIAVAEAARNLVCSGATPAALTDCLNFGNPEKPGRFWQFKNCVEGIADAAKFLNIPVVSGNISFYNENPKGAIYPTPTIGMIGIIDSMKRITTQFFKDENDLVILLGTCGQELGGSEYLKKIHGLVLGDAPALDLKLEEAVHNTVREAIGKGLVRSAHDCSEGGLAVALAECCVSDPDRQTGVVIDNLSVKIRKDALLFGESQSRVILSCSKNALTGVMRLARKHGVPATVIGRCQGRALKIFTGRKIAVNLVLDRLYAAWGDTLEKTLSNIK